MHKYTEEVLTVEVNHKRLGFITRREVLYGYTPDIENEWYATRCIIKPNWNGSFKTGKLAKEYLKQLNKEGNA